MTGNKQYTGEIAFREIEKLSMYNYQVRYEFALMEGEQMLSYTYFDTKDTSYAGLVNGVIRERYTAEQVEAIINNYLNDKDIIEFERLQNYRAYAKAIASNNEQAATECKQATMYEVILPFDQTLSGGDYEAMAEHTVKVKIPFTVDLANNAAKCYPKYILPDDLSALQSDPRVTINTIALYEPSNY